MGQEVGLGKIKVAKPARAAPVPGGSNYYGPGKRNTRTAKGLDLHRALDTDEARRKSVWTWRPGQFPKAKRWPDQKGKDPGEANNQGVNLRK